MILYSFANRQYKDFMKIYHYTSIQTLALILKHKKIRFNRLDLVDDMEESSYGSGPFQTKLGIYTFVSCWTKNSRENLALWNMYTRYKGVRIGIDEMPFITYKVNDNFTSLIPYFMKFGSDYFMTLVDNEAKLYDVEYVSNPQEEIKKLITPTEKGYSIDTTRIGIFKRKEWSMQEESRFKINVNPVDVNGAAKETLNNPTAHPYPFLFKIFSTFGNSLITNKPIETTYIDLDLDNKKLDNIEIMMGPLTSEADRVIVESLLNPFANAHICESVFRGKLREKS